ncbi:hypothetical protein BKA63DRAFT_56189 [Paraphoma chrysanthemicola]|nr:hypothetical protein BKA63DRAFT_56189 [Paraphoma chrysanthemicola]
MSDSSVPKAFQNDQTRQPFVYQQDLRQSKESPKLAVDAYLDRKELLIHLIGFSATGVVIGLHAFNHYWVDLGDDGSLSINATLKYLQFAAKLHETAMMASISCVLLFFLHRRLVDRGVSFGHLDAPYMIGAGGGAGLLITKRFWSPFWLHKRFFVMLILSIIFTLALNPASAIALIPSLAYWDLSNPYGLGKGNEFKVYFSLPFQRTNGSRLPSPWPTAEPEGGWPITTNACFNASATDELDCAAGGMEQISQWVDGNILLGSSSNLTMNEPTNFQRLVVSQPLEAGSSNFARHVSRKVSTTPTFMSTTAIGGFWAYVQRRRGAKINDGVRWPLLKSKEGSSTYQPIIYSQCQSDVYNINNTGRMHNITFDMLQAPWNNNPKPKDLYLDADDDIVQDLPARHARFGWYGGKSLSTMSFTVIPIEISNATKNNFQSSLVVTCLFDARWTGSAIKLKPRQSSLVESNLTDFSIFEEARIRDKYKDKTDFKNALNMSDLVVLPRNWLKGFNFNVTHNDTEVPIMVRLFDNMLNSTEHGNQHFQITELDTPKTLGTTEFVDYQNNITDFVGKFHSMLLVDGMARFASWLWRPYLEIPSRSGNGYEYVNLIGSNWIANTYTADEVFLNGTKADAYSIEFEASRYGYGYGFRSDDTGVSIYVAIAILGLYELITIAYVVTIFWYRCTRRYTRSQAWEAMINLIALAKNSESSAYMVGTSAGVDKWDTWKLKVQIREMDDERLNLAFVRQDEEIGEEPGIMKKYE